MQLPLRFEELSADLVMDRTTRLVWARDAGLFEFPLSWREGLETVERMNRSGCFGRNDWRMPNRCELRSLLKHGARRPALPAAHPFRQVFSGWYWTSTTAAIATGYAWYVHLEGARMFFGAKQDYHWLWPVCGKSEVLPRTGQTTCYDEQGLLIPCEGTGQDGALRAGTAWPSPRFSHLPEGALDHLTGLTWSRQAGLDGSFSGWLEARQGIRSYAEQTGLPWRMPTIRELESLVDASMHSPALPSGHRFSKVHDTYWSATTSGFDTDWVFALYLNKGAVGVGHKKTPGFSVWPVMEKETGEKLCA